MPDLLLMLITGYDNSFYNLLIVKITVTDTVSSRVNSRSVDLAAILTWNLIGG